MKEKVIRTNERCKKCDGFLIFEVCNANENKNGYKILYGVWICTICEGTTLGLWAGYENIRKEKNEIFEERSEIRGLVESSFDTYNKGIKNL